MEELFRKYIDGHCSKEEILLLLSYFKDPENEHRLRLLIREGLEKSWDNEGEEDWSVITEQTLKNILQQMDAGRARSVPLYKRHWLSIAASLLIIFSLAAYFFSADRQGNKSVATQKEQVSITPDLQPGSNKAMLTLSDGTTVLLDSAGNGLLAQQGGIQIHKKDGQILYDGSGEKAGEIQYNTVSTPRGGQYQLVLSDGTEVWLNAASSLRYPANFSGPERKVFLTGEGYFEVAKDKTPFRVSVDNRSTVEVLGTHFNINAFAEEPSVATTLLEGKVRVMSQISSSVLELSPGQQSRMGSDGKIVMNQSPDLEDVMAWKNGKFHFGESSNIQTIMNQIARWYDVEIVYEGTVSDHIGGTISRDVNASKVFEMLEMTGSVAFRIEGKKVVVMPQKK